MRHLDAFVVGWSAGIAFMCTLDVLAAWLRSRRAEKAFEREVAQMTLEVQHTVALANRLQARWPVRPEDRQ